MTKECGKCKHYSPVCKDPVDEWGECLYNGESDDLVDVDAGGGCELWEERP